MKPEIWGPHAWIFLHSVTMEYPDSPTNVDKENMTNFMESLKSVLPCKKCRINFENHLRDFPLDDTVLNSKKNLVKWLIDTHNSVNRINGKKEIDYESALNKIFNFYKGNSLKKKFIIYVVIFIILFTFILFLFQNFI
jgi:hypothetical protein